MNPTNIAFLLQKATQKYQKLTFYWLKCCYLFLPSSFTNKLCFNSRVFSVLGHSTLWNSNVTSDHSCRKYWFPKGFLQILISSQISIFAWNTVFAITLVYPILCFPIWKVYTNISQVKMKFLINSSVQIILKLSILKGKVVFYSIKYNNGDLATPDLFHVLTQSIKFYTSHYHILKSTDVWKMRFINERVKMNGCSFPQVLRQNLGWFLF